jgi:hypothetical protein
MPSKKDAFPGSKLSQLDWSGIANGEVWFFSNEELKELGTKPETLRAYAHNYAKAEGFKFRTKMTGEGLYIQTR